MLKPEGRMVLTSSMPDFRFGPLMADHFAGSATSGVRAARRARSRHGKARDATTAGAMRGSRAIGRRERSGEYYSPDEPALERFLESQRPHGLGNFEIGRSMADQNFFATATKPAPVGLTV